MARKLCGYDLNGWHDFAARNWKLTPGEGEVFETTSLSDGGLLSSIVSAGDDALARWIGGVQAELAPHGRGDGWGEVGRRERRASVRTLLDDSEAQPDLIASALRGIVSGASHAVLAIDDLPVSTERHQETLLAALTAARIGHRLLVWRPVLAALFATEHLELAEGQTIGVICHAAEGLALQTLRLRREQGRSSALIAPERRHAGHELRSQLGYRGLVQLARSEVLKHAKSGRNDHLEWARSIAELAMGHETRPEILRLANGDWEVMSPPDQLPLPRMDVDKEELAKLAACDCILFETVTAGAVRDHLIDAISSVLDREVTALPVTAVAEGGLVAAQRLASNDPIYFDFLPQISTIVQGAAGAANYDLIDAKETLAAGRFYRSERPARLGIPAGQESFSVFLRKEAEKWPRKAVVNLGKALPETIPVDLWVEQMPAAGRARILLQSPEQARQFAVEWDAATELRRSWEEIIADLATPLPTIPARLVLPCGMQAWLDSNRGPGLTSLLRENVGAERVDWEALAAKLSSRPMGKYCISSDGEIPHEVSAADIERLDQLTRRALEEVRSRVSGRSTSYDNASLKFLTWQFRRCPADVVEHLIESWSARLAMFNHPFVTHNSHWMLVYQGLGRTAGTEVAERKAFGKLFDRPESSWVWREETACAAFLLSRSDSAPLLLDRNRVDILANRVLREFRDNLGGEYTKFAYAPFLLVGLLRWRLKEPRALVAGHDPIATKMADAVRRTLEDLNRKVKKFPKLKKYIDILKDVSRELEGVGSNPDLLLDIYNVG